MPPVVTRALHGCLAIVALLMSAWGSLRAAVERPLGDRGDGCWPIVADARCARVAREGQPTAAVATAPIAAPIRAASTPSAPRCAAPVVEVPALAAPSPRLGAANGPRAP